MKVKTLGFVVAALLALSAPSLSNPALAKTTGFTVSFDANGGSGVMSKQVIPAKGKALPSVKFVRDSQQFLGWSTSRAGAVKYRNNSVIKPKSKLTLYAQWKPTVAKPDLLGHELGKLLWSDSFTGSSGSSIDSSNWTARYCGHENENGGGTCHNSEKQWYTPDAIGLDGSAQGNAVITTKKVTVAPANAGACLSVPCSFTSGRFDTQKKVSLYSKLRSVSELFLPIRSSVKRSNNYPGCYRGFCLTAG
jgi:hypothetical protein